MYYELYIDVFFLENFMMDSLILFLINRILKCGRSPGRILAGAVLGSLLTCLVLFLPLPGAGKQILYHLVVGVAMLIAALGPVSAVQLIRAYVLMYVCAVFLGGILLVFRPYIRGAVLFYGAAVPAYFIFLKLWKLLVCLHDYGNHVICVSLYTEKGQTDVTALLDTGNRLRDVLTGDPVCVIARGTAMKIPGIPEMKEGFRMIPYQYVGGSSVIPVFRICRMCIHMEEDKWIDHPLLGIGEESMPERYDGYEMILNPAIIAE